MTFLKIIAIALPLGGALVAAAAIFAYRSAMAEADKAWRAVAAGAVPSARRFEHASVAALPEIAQRYFRHAIAEGTPLMSTIELEMRGRFLLGGQKSHQDYTMTARQILRPPSEFVWLPRMTRGLMRISGSDALVGGRGWTRFWLLGLIPVVNAGGQDVARSASFRAAMESIWVPPSLLPENGVRWEQTGPNTARITIQRVSPEIAVELTLNADGSVKEIIGQRWSNANPDNVFRLQPFGGTIEGERTFSGYTIPSRLAVGNHFRTGAFLAFFQAEVTSATFL